MWFIILVVIIDASLWGLAAISPLRYAEIGTGTKLVQGILCIANTIAVVMLFMR